MYWLQAATLTTAGVNINYCVGSLLTQLNGRQADPVSQKYGYNTDTYSEV